MAKPRKKKYRPKTARTPAILFDVIVPPMEKEERERLELSALSALKQIELGKGTADNFATAATVVDNLFILAAVFKEKADLQLLALLATGALMGAKGSIADGKIPELCMIKIVREAIRVQQILVQNCSRSELVASARVSYEHYRDIRGNPKAAYIIDPNQQSNDDIETLEDCIGITFINGKARSGYLHFDHERSAWLWKMPKEDMQAVITEPIFVIFVENLEK